MGKPKFAPREIFEQILEWSVIPTFDLVIEQKSKGIILVRRKIAPYKDQWALAGLRMYKGEDLEDTIKRIAKNELGLKVDTSKKKFLGQYVGKFVTENHRQDLSTGYAIKIPKDEEIKINKDHFSDMRYIQTKNQIPDRIGAMYKYYLLQYFDLIK